MKKKLLFVVNSLYGGGAENILQNLLRHLDMETYDVTLCSVLQGELNNQYPQGIKFDYIYDQIKPGYNRLQILWVLIRNKIKLIIYEKLGAKLFYRLFVRLGKFDTEIAFIEGYSTRIVSGSTNPKSRKLAWVHIDMVENHWTTIAFRSYDEEVSSYKVFDKVLCVSDYASDQFRKLFPEIGNVATCHNPVDNHAIVRLAQEPLANPNFIKKDFTMVTIGRLVHQKSYDRLLAVVKRLKDDGFTFSLNIIGEGSNRPQLEAYIKAHKLQDDVHILGFMENPYPYLNASDLFVCSSRSEGYSTVVTEALILGIPVVTTDCSGMNEILADGKYGMITRNDSDSLYEGLKQVLSDKALYDHYKQMAQERSSYFSLETLMAGFCSLL